MNDGTCAPTPGFTGVEPIGAEVRDGSNLVALPHADALRVARTLKHLAEFATWSPDAGLADRIIADEADAMAETLADFAVVARTPATS